jgi:DNA-binding XRE family transcriptional regulator
MSISKHIAGALASQRRRLGLTLEQTAELAGVSRHTVRHLEQHVSDDCSLGVAERVCAAVGLELTVGIRGARGLAGALTHLDAASPERLIPPNDQP